MDGGQCQPLRVNARPVLVLVIVVVLETAQIKEVRTIEDHLDEGKLSIAYEIEIDSDFDFDFDFDLRYLEPLGVVGTARAVPTI